MPWSADDAKEALFRAVLALQETHGEKTTIAFLRDELTRLTVLREHKRTNSEILRLTAQLDATSSQLENAMDALGFYAEESAYVAKSGTKSAIDKDRGRRARDTLSALSGDARDEEAE